MQITFMDDKKITFCKLPKKISGQYFITQKTDDGKEENILTVEGVRYGSESKWLIKSTRFARIFNDNGNPTKEVILEVNKIYSVNITKNNSMALLYGEYLTDDKICFDKYIVLDNCTITIGKLKDNDIIYNNAYVSRQHAVLTFNTNKVKIEDKDSSNGTYLNNNYIKNSDLSPGDVIYIIGLKILIGNGFIAINNPNNLMTINTTKLLDYKYDKVNEETDDWSDFNELNEEFFSRSPRFKKSIVKKEIKIDSPPQIQNPEGTPLMLMIGPSMTMGMSSLFMGYFALQNVLNNGGSVMTAMPTLSMSFFMMLGMVMWPILIRRYEGKKKKERENKRQEKYTNYIQDIHKFICKTIEEQSEILRENYISVSECRTIIRNRTIDLWIRQHNHDDFLEIRLGVGQLPLKADIKYPERKFTLDEDNLQDKLYELVETPKLLNNVPITHSFIEHFISGIIGDRKIVRKFVDGLIIQLIALHSYDDLKLIFIYDKNEKKHWEFVKWLPHTFDENKEIRFIASNQDDVKELSAYLENIFTYRKELSVEKAREEKEHYIIFSLSKTLEKRAEIVKQILEYGKRKAEYIGFSLIAVYDEIKNLPKECKCVIELDYDRGKIYSDYTNLGGLVEFIPDNTSLQVEDLAISLLNTKLDSSTSTFQLPEMYTFMEMFKVGNVEHLNCITKWSENNPANTLKTPIGVDSYGDLFYLDLHEKYHGPHGLIAGMTGSGKSEFIMTYILSMAVNYHPHEVAFILIDFKGGGMADTFDKLPHLAGKITNLDGAEMNRSLVSIDSELKRRQRVFSKTSSEMDVSNVDIYKYQQLYREKKVKEPIQHLIIISDEFAELKTQQPEFMEKLVSAARIGRSLGVHLILATQKPSGVVDDQIWSNSKFRICLKVQERADSMDMIKRPEAANLTVTGRYYVQVGFNELFEIGQSAWAGAPYFPSDRFEQNNDESIIVVDEIGREVRKVEISKKQKYIKNPHKQIDEITKYLNKLADEENIKVRKLWLEPIDPFIFIKEIEEKYNYSISDANLLNPIVGEVDDPQNQRQMIMSIPISTEGNVIIYGATGSGKTTFLNVLIYSLMNQHTPDEVNMYILDFGAETLKAFSEAPHVGDVVLSHEAEKVNNLFKMLNEEMNCRKSMFSDFGIDFNKYNKINENKIESIVVIIQNFSAFSEMYDELEESIRFLSREGTKFGIYFVLTATSTNSVRYRTLQNFNQLFALRFNDLSEYNSVVGNTGGLIPAKYKGRGLVKLNKVHEFQSAHLTHDIEDTFEFIRNESLKLKEIYSDVIKRKIPILPEQVTPGFFDGMLPQLSRLEIPIGINKSSLEPVTAHITSSCIHIISSLDGEGSMFMQGIAEMLNQKNDGEIIVIDPLDNFLNYNYKIETNGNNSVVDMFNVLVDRNNTYKAAKESGETLPEYESIVYIINSFSDLMRSISEDSKDKMKLLLEKNEIEYNVHFIIFEKSSTISTLAIEQWFKKHCPNMIDVWLGNGIMDQYPYAIKVSKPSSDMYGEIEDDFGYYIKKGKVKLIKYIKTNNGDNNLD